MPPEISNKHRYSPTHSQKGMIITQNLNYKMTTWHISVNRLELKAQWGGALTKTELEPAQQIDQLYRAFKFRCAFRNNHDVKKPTGVSIQSAEITAAEMSEQLHTALMLYTNLDTFVSSVPNDSDSVVSDLVNSQW